MDDRTRRAIEQLAREVARIDRAQRTQGRGSRTPQLAHSSIDSGALEVRDPATGGTRMRIGWVDGAAGVITEGGDPVSEPSPPLVDPSLGGLRVTWDGKLNNEVALPVDFDHMAVHVSTESGFAPSAATYVGTIRRAGDGGMLPVVPLPYQVHYVVLVPVTTGGVQGAPSAEASATPLKVDAPDLTAGSVQAVHIAAGAIEADKLEAVLALVTTIIAGIPGAARVELDQDGLRGYDSGNELIFAIDAQGNAVFSGDVTGSLISGSRMVIGAPPGPHGAVEEADGGAQATVTAANRSRAQLRASGTQAEVAAYRDAADPDTAAVGIAADASSVFLNLSSGVGTGMPAVSGGAGESTSGPAAVMSVRSGQGPLVQPHITMRAEQQDASLAVGSGDSTASAIYLTAQTGTYSALHAYPQAPAPGSPALGAPGSLYAYRSADNDYARLALQGPTTADGDGAGRRAMVHLTAPHGAALPYAAADISARRVRILPEADPSAGTDDGVLSVSTRHSILADRHAPVTSVLAAQPTGTGSGGDWVDFTAAQFPPITFRTGYSGRVRVTIAMCGVNNASAGATLSTGFRLSGASALPADLSRAAMVRAAEPRGGGSNNYGIQQTTVVYLSLGGNASYTLTPAWRATGTPAWGSGASGVLQYDLAYNTAITVEPLM